MQLSKGFTLIELLIAIAIVAILSAIALPSYESHVTKGKIQTAKADLLALTLIVENQFQRQLSYPVPSANPTITTAATDEQFPGWKRSQDVDFQYSYQATATTYILTATGKNSKVSGCVLTLKSDGSRIASNCKGVPEW